MAFDDQSFIQKLRMNNVFPAEGKGLPNPLIGMPNFYAGQPRQESNNMAGLRNQVPDQQVTTPVRQPFQNAPNTEPPNVVYKPSGLHFIGDRILGPTVAEREMMMQEQLPALAKIQQTGQLKQGDLALKYRKQELAEKIADGKATDAEKQEYKLAQIEASGANTMEQIGARGDIGSRQIQERGAIDKELQGTRGSQALEQIGARTAGAKEVANIRTGGGSMSPSQIGNQQNNALREIALTDPSVAQYIIEGEDGRLQLRSDTPLGVVADIKSRVFGKGTSNVGDIQLPATKIGGTPTSKTPTTKTPTAADLIKKYSE